MYLQLYILKIFLETRFSEKLYCFPLYTHVSSKNVTSRTTKTNTQNVDYISTLA